MRPLPLGGGHAAVEHGAPESPAGSVRTRSSTSASEAVAPSSLSSMSGATT